MKTFSQFVKESTKDTEKMDAQELNRQKQHLKNKADELWKQFSEEQRDSEWEKTKNWFQKNAGFTPKETDKSSFYWVMSDNGLQYVLTRFDKSEWDNWKKSARVDQQVAYKGYIPPQYLKIKEL